jgi:hypothetical protein
MIEVANIFFFVFKNSRLEGRTGRREQTQQGRSLTTAALDTLAVRGFISFNLGYDRAGLLSNMNAVTSTGTVFFDKCRVTDPGFGAFLQNGSGSRIWI